MHSTTQLASGRWQARWRDATGIGRKASFDTEAEARRFLRQQQEHAARGTSVDAMLGRLTFRDYAERWRALQLHRPSSAARVDSVLRNHVYPLIGDLPLARLRHSDLQRVATTMANHLGARTTINNFAVVKAILAAARADRALDHDPAARVKLPRPAHVDVEAIDADQVDAIAEAIAPEHRALVWVGAGLGLRQGEAFGLTVDAVDLDAGRVVVARQLIRDGHRRRLGPLKTEQSRRTIPLAEPVATELAQHLECYPSDHPDGLVFTSAQGMALRHDGWNRRVWKPAVEAAGLPELTFHDLRHFYASTLIRSGRVSPPAAARFLGHSVKTLLATYAHWFRDDDGNARAAIEAAFAPRGASVVPLVRPIGA
jgi:integrase